MTIDGFLLTSHDADWRDDDPPETCAVGGVGATSIAGVRWIVRGSWPEPSSRMRISLLSASGSAIHPYTTSTVPSGRTPAVDPAI